MKMKYKTLLYEKEGSVGTLTLNRPDSLNSINDQMISELTDFWTLMQTENAIRVIILTGAGSRGFCAGGDLKEAGEKFSKQGPDALTAYNMSQGLSNIIWLMRQSPQPIIAGVRGAATGGGFCMALAGDIRIITDTAKFCASFINIGMSGGEMGSSYLFSRLIGLSRATEYLLTGDFLMADEAHRIGFVSKIVTDEDLMPSCMDMAKKMAGKSVLGLRLTKQIINQGIAASGLKEALLMESANQTLCVMSGNLTTQM